MKSFSNLCVTGLNPGKMYSDVTKKVSLIKHRTAQ